MTVEELRREYEERLAAANKIIAEQNRAIATMRAALMDGCGAAARSKGRVTLTRLITANPTRASLRSAREVIRLSRHVSAV
jgi:hypothetical protein